MLISSRPEAFGGLVLTELDSNELELISAYLWITRLGAGVSPYRDAASTLMSKIENLMGTSFMEQAYIGANMKINIMDHTGRIERSVHAALVEIDI